MSKMSFFEVNFFFQELGTSNFWGKLGWYGGGGYVQNLHNTKDRSEAIIRVGTFYFYQ